MSVMIVVVGAGLSGLYLGSLLKAAGVSFTILEGQNRIGGRIRTEMGPDGTHLEMGPTWLWRENSHLHALLDELNIDRFPQRTSPYAGFTIKGQPAQLMPVPGQQPSERLVGGTQELTTKLYGLVADRVHLNQRVRQIEKTSIGYKIITDSEEFVGKQLIWAAPPKLIRQLVIHGLPNELQELASNTHTWMEDSGKAMVSYQKPFWLEHPSKGTFFSQDGPLTESYDHSNSNDTGFALGGFLHPESHGWSRTDRERGIIDQLASLYGAEARKPLAYHEWIWSTDEWVSPFPQENVPHQNNGHVQFQQAWMNDFYMSSAETDPNFGGYMEGAVRAAERVFDQLRKQATRPS